MRQSPLLLLLLATCFGCASEPPWNVLIVTLDTTRADRIGCYGDEHATTPAIDRLAAQGALLENAYAPVPITLPSHSSLMTGKVPFTHGARDNGLFVLGEEQTTLAEILRQAGYRTAASIGAYPLTAQFGIDQGFDLFDDHVAGKYEDVFGHRVFPKELLFFDERPAARVNDAVLPWIEENHEAPFFLWLHYFDPHHPHQPPSPFDQVYVHDLYAGEIAYSDESLGVILDHLQRLEVLDRTLVVLTADHGEGLGEHREATHSLLVYSSTLHVPLIFKVPDRAGEAFAGRGRRFAERVGLVDVLPTVLDLLDLEIPEGIQGRSLRPLLEGPPAEPMKAPPIYAETLSPRLTQGWGELRAWIDGDLKYIHGPRPELYDLAVDPHELQDLIDARPETAAGLRQELESYLSEHAVAGLDSSVAIDDATASRLAALGYLHGSGDAVGPLEERLRDDGDPPQDHAATISLLSSAKQLLFLDRPLEARERISELLRLDDDSPEYLMLMANAELKLGHVDQALQILESLAQAGLAHQRPSQVLHMIAGILLHRGDIDAAYGRYRDAEAIEETALGQYRLAKIHELRDEPLDQRRFLKQALELEPTFIPARINLGVWYAMNGDLDQAETHLLRAIADHPYHERSFFNYGVLLIQSGRADEATQHLERAVTLRPDYLQARSALIELYAGSGHRDEALRHYRQLTAISPQGAEARLSRQILEIEQ